MLSSCAELLDIKPDRALVVPKTLKDLENILNNTSVMNEFPSLAVIAAEDYHLQVSGINNLWNNIEKNTYLWKKDLYEGNSFCPDWQIPYSQIFYANIVLEGLSKIDPKSTEKNTVKNLQGRAYFFRAWALFHLLQFFSESYEDKTSTFKLGIPLKLEADVNVRHKRATIAEVYDQILKDLIAANDLLQIESDFPTQPNKVAVYAFLSRVHHTMENYEQALKYANLCLSVKDNLIDYNTLNPLATRPMPRAILGDNQEVIFYSRLINYGFFFSSVLLPDSSLTNLYSKDDLRKNLYFHPTTGRFIGSYTGDSRLFSGLAIDEIFLIRAECYARLNELEKAKTDLNRLISSRYRNSTYNPFQEIDQVNLIKSILNERRKQLFSRGLRWIDLRRVNKDKTYADTLYRNVESSIIAIYPNDSRYILTIPPNEISGNNIEQNIR